MVAPRPLQDIVVSAEITDISTAGSAFVACPTSGRIVKILTCTHGIITGADADITAEINTVAVTGSLQWMSRGSIL